METVFVSHLTPDQHQKVAKLVGKRCTVFCKMNGKTVEALGTLVPKLASHQKNG